MSEIDNIVTAVEKFPENAQGQACTGIIAAFLSGNTASDIGSGAQTIEALAVATAANASHADDVSEPRDLEWYADHYDLESASDMDFAAFVAYYYCEVAPDDERLDTIDGGQFKVACEIVGHDVPSRPSQTLNNAKTRKKYLQAKGSGKYTLSRQGRRFVRDTLLVTESE